MKPAEAKFYAIVAAMKNKKNGGDLHIVPTLFGFC
jgi:hypothetical protein